MWKVLFSTQAEKEVKALIKKGKLTPEDQEVIATWIKQIKEFGPDSLTVGSNFWYDHELFDNWKGHRSSAFSFKGRLIYKIKNKQIIVLVVKVTTDHDYSGGNK